MYMKKEMRNNLTDKWNSFTQEQKDMFHMIGIDGPNDIKLSSKGYLYHKVHRNFYQGIDNKHFMSARASGFVHYKGDGYYVLTMKGRSYLASLYKINFIDKDRLIKY